MGLGRSHVRDGVCWLGVAHTVTCELRVDGQWLTQVLLQSLKIVNVR